MLLNLNYLHWLMSLNKFMIIKYYNKRHYITIFGICFWNTVFKFEIKNHECITRNMKFILVRWISAVELSRGVLPKPKLQNSGFLQLCQNIELSHILMYCTTWQGDFWGTWQNIEGCIITEIWKCSFAKYHCPVV
jgi:hypothetical protein